MSQWIERIVTEFPVDLARFWIAADPDDVLLDEQVLSTLRGRGFAVLPFEDSVTFRAEYETRYRAAWDRGEDGPTKALVLHLRGTNTNDLPWDYLKQARKVSLSLADLFPMLSYSVVRQIGAEYLEMLFEVQCRYASQSLGEAATKDFILTHIFRINPHLISRSEDLWRELLRLHFRDEGLPTVLANHVVRVLGNRDAFKDLPIHNLISSKSVLLRVVQEAWYQYLERRGVTGTQAEGRAPPEYLANVDVPFEHPDVRVIIDSMFLEGALHPLLVQGQQVSIPEWAKVGIVQDPTALRNLVLDGIESIMRSLPGLDASYRDWTHLSRRLGEVIARFHDLDAALAGEIKGRVLELQNAADERLRRWVGRHYSDLPSLPVVKGPVMVHHIPRFLSMRYGVGEARIALLVFDGLAIDQWIQVRESVAKRSQNLRFDESACFAWLPTLTSVSRQALFSGLKPREFSDTIESTARESTFWSRFWQDHGMRPSEVLYRKGIKRTDQLDDLDTALANPAIKIAGIVVDTVDEIVHGAILGKRGIASQISSWCESGFVERLLALLFDKGFHVYLTADHGNVEAVGQGRPNQGAAPELRGERVRIYRTETLAAESASSNANTYRLDIAGLPATLMPLFADGRTAFVPQGEQVVGHGGISVEELIVPFVKVSQLSLIE
jgi:hypothetical protein